MATGSALGVAVEIVEEVRELGSTLIRGFQVEWHGDGLYVRYDSHLEVFVWTIGALDDAVGYIAERL